MESIRTRPSNSLLEVHYVVAPFATNAFQLTPLIETQYFSQVEIHECVFAFQLTPRSQDQVDLRADLSLIGLIGVEQRLQFQILLFHLRAIINKFDLMIIKSLVELADLVLA